MQNVQNDLMAVWNSLLKTVLNSDTAAVFKSMLKAFLDPDGIPMIRMGVSR